MREQRDFDTQGLEQRVGNDNQWVKLRELIGWESFRSLVKVLDRTSERGGRPPYDPVKMFKVVILGQWHSLSDVDLETALRVRLDFILFCGFGVSWDVPDSTTIQDYRSRMIES